MALFGGKTHRITARCIAVLATAITLSAASGCAGNSQDYDISPIFPLTANKCEKYDGKVEGSGLLAHCWVTKEKCEQAVADWRKAMRSGGVTDAIEFSCN